jgi:hypothetical protein
MMVIVPEKQKVGAENQICIQTLHGHSFFKKKRARQILTFVFFIGFKKKIAT